MSPARNHWPAIALILALLALPLRSETIETCSPNEHVPVGPYVVQTDYWNKDKCPGVQCVNIDSQTGGFTVTENTPVCPDVSSYPSIVLGKAWGVVSNQKDLPAQISSLQCVNSSWEIAPTNTGAWDAAYDIWICPDDNCGPTGFTGGAEIMVWVDYLNCSGWKDYVGPVTLSGQAWEVWQWDPSFNGQHWKYVAYLAKTKSTNVINLDLNGFLKDSVARGFIQPSWYLYAVEAGNEMRKDGLPFTSKFFSCSVNKYCGAEPKNTPVPNLQDSAHDLAVPVCKKETGPPVPSADSLGVSAQPKAVSGFEAQTQVPPGLGQGLVVPISKSEMGTPVIVTTVTPTPTPVK